LQTAGVIILYVSHRLDEIMSLTNRTAVLRDGELISTYQTADISSTQLVHDMVGRPLEQVFPHARATETGEMTLQLQKVSCSEMFENVSLELRAGEILGLAGLVGSGRSELARAIYGLYPVDSGEMKLQGKPWSPSHPAESLQAGLIYLPEERKKQGLVLDHSVSDTVAVGLLDQLSDCGIVSSGKESAVLNSVIQKYDVRTTGPQQPIGELSGGNQQKVLLARWLERDPNVIILDEPTRGIDIGAKQAIHTIIDQLAAQGKAVLLISSDLPEILGMSDRVLVLDRGRISAELRGTEMTEQNVILASSGLYQRAET
jgi:ABC-type sugar transport system ATPase subunit